MSIHEQYNEDYSRDGIPREEIERIKKALELYRQSINIIGGPRCGESLAVVTSAPFLEPSAPDQPTIAGLKTRMRDLSERIAQLRREVAENGNDLTAQIDKEKGDLQEDLANIIAEVDRLYR
jgi:hypothetical protein